MKIQFTSEAFKKYQEELKNGKQFGLCLVKGGCCGYVLAFEVLYTSGNKRMIEILLPETDADGKVRYLPSGTSVPVTSEASEIARSALIDYKASGFKKSFKVYPNQIKD